MGGIILGAYITLGIGLIYLVSMALNYRKIEKIKIKYYFIFMFLFAVIIIYSMIYIFFPILSTSIFGVLSSLILVPSGIAITLSIIVKIKKINRNK